MRYYPAVISKNETNLPTNFSLDDYVKVRIPAFHGCSESVAQRMKNSSGEAITISSTMCSDDDLPWAILSRSLDSKDFSATSLNENDLVFVILANDNVNSPIITGFASRFAYTDDPMVAQSNLVGGGSGGTYGGNYADGSCGFEEFGGANAIVKKALSQVGRKETAENCIMYNDEYYGRTVSGPDYAWCAAFVWWVFNNTYTSWLSTKTYADYYYGGEKTAYCPTLMSYYKNKNQFITSGFKAGDIIFFNWDGGVNAQHVGIVATDTTDNTSDVDCVEGNTNNGNGTKDGVYRKKRQRKFILGAARLGLPKEDSIATGSNKEQVFKFLTRGLSFGSEGKQFNAAVACGIMANIEKESSFNPNAGGDSGTSYGLCQWHDTSAGSGRMTNLKNFCSKNGYDPASITGQMFFLQSELNSGYSSMVNKFLSLPNNADSAGKAAEQWCRDFERPAEVDKRAAERSKAAKENYWPQFGA